MNGRSRLLWVVSMLPGAALAVTVLELVRLDPEPDAAGAQVACSPAILRTLGPVQAAWGTPLCP